jgi:hypothetical protein
VILPRLFHGDRSIAQIVQEAFIKAGEFGIVSQNEASDETLSNIYRRPIDAGYTGRRKFISE